MFSRHQDGSNCHCLSSFSPFSLFPPMLLPSNQFGQEVIKAWVQDTRRVHDWSTTPMSYSFSLSWNGNMSLTREPLLAIGGLQCHHGDVHTDTTSWSRPDTPTPSETSWAKSLLSDTLILSTPWPLSHTSGGKVYTSLDYLVFPFPQVPTQVLNRTCPRYECPSCLTPLVTFISTKLQGGHFLPLTLSHTNLSPECRVIVVDVVIASFHFFLPTFSPLSFDVK